VKAKPSEASAINVGQKPNRGRRIGDARQPEWGLSLYVAGPTRKSSTAFRNLQQICDEHLAGRYHIEVIDLMKNPQIARDDQIVAVPTVVRKLPLPIRRVIGDLSNTGRVMAGLDLRPHDPFPFAARKGEKNV
jgi:circadian clock protein KaiB